MNLKKIVLLILFLLLVALFFAFDLQQVFNLEYFQAQRDVILAYTADNFLESSLAYFFLYITVAALSLPAAAILTIAGGAIFGFAWGLFMVSFASTIGATLAFLLSRTLLRDWVQARFGKYLRPINEGVEKDGAFYLFTLRLIPAFPFFLVNVVMALTPISTVSFYIVSQLGMLFGTALFVNVGAELGLATTLPDIFNIGVIRAVVVIAIFPWLAKSGLGFVRNHKVMAPWNKCKPEKFDTNMLVIGGGSAGLVTSYIAALVKARVTLVEKHSMGGDCLNTGCVPSKALIRSASVNHLISRADDFGLENGQATVNFKAVMARVKDVIKTIEPHDSMERYCALGVDCIQGEAKILSPWTVQVGEQEISARNIVIATGARPFVPPIPGLEDIDYLTSDSLWDIEELPAKLLVMGGGPIGCELAQAFSRLGAKVILVDMLDRIMSREDPEVSAYISQRFTDEGIEVITSHQIKGFEKTESKKLAIISGEDGERLIEFDQVLVAVGRKANTENFGLEALGIALNQNGTVKVNEFLQTNFPNIFACGDVAGPFQFTHIAAFQAWFAAVNSLFGSFKKFRIHYDVVPWATFVDPEVARVGLNELEAEEKGIAYEVTRYGIDDLDRAIADSEAQGFVKILTVPGKDKILGAVIVGYHASELINEFVFAMTHGLGLKKIMATIHIYPTLSESGKFAAGEWRKKMHRSGYTLISKNFTAGAEDKTLKEKRLCRPEERSDLRQGVQNVETHSKDTQTQPNTRSHTMNTEANVSERYADGAKEVEPSLCCPVEYDAGLLKLLPKEIIDKDYGCGDPSRYVEKGDTVLDLGSGGGKICYMAAQLIGEAGQVIGVDMTDEMLDLARKYQSEMAEKLGNDRVSFRKGYIQDLALNLEAREAFLLKNPGIETSDPEALANWEEDQKINHPLVDDASVDIVVSNCVLNLVDEKHRTQMISEIFRVLKPGGRVAISDIVSDEFVPQHLKDDDHLWSGCISGAFQESEFMQVFLDAGFVDVAYDKWDEEPWQVVEGIEFRSVTVMASRPCSEAQDKGHTVIYRGPFAELKDDQSTVYPRGMRVAVSEAVFQTLLAGMAKDSFIFIGPGPSVPEGKNITDDRQRSPTESKGVPHHIGGEKNSSCC